MSWNAVIGAVLIIIVVVVIVSIARKHRTAEDEDLRQIAAASDFTFLPAGDQAFVDGLMAFPLLGDRGPAGSHHAYAVSRLFTHEAGGATVSLFTVHHRVDIPADESVPSTVLQDHDVFLVRLRSGRIPACTLRPRQAADRLNSLFGRREIGFPRDPGFSARFVLTGDDEAAVQELFSDDLRVFLAELPGRWTAECTGDAIVLYGGTGTTRIAPGTVREMLHDALRLRSLLMRR